MSATAEQVQARTDCQAQFVALLTEATALNEQRAAAAGYLPLHGERRFKKIANALSWVYGVNAW